MEAPNQPPVRDVEEWMLVCQCTTASEEQVDWTQAGRAYPNLREMPSFISRHRQSAPESTFTTTAEAAGLHHGPESGSTPPLRMIVAGTAGTANPLPETATQGQSACGSTHRCSSIQHRWPHPPLPPGPACQGRLQGLGGRVSPQTAEHTGPSQLPHHRRDVNGGKDNHGPSGQASPSSIPTPR